MGYFQKVLVLVTLFILTGLLSSHLGVSNVHDEETTIFQQIDLPLTGWKERKVITSEAVLDTLAADVTVFSDYSKNNSQPVNLYIGYYKTLEQAKLSHAPQVCFTAQGWIMQKNDKIPMMLNNESLIVNRLILEKESNRTLVYYWYQTDSQIFPDLFKMKLSLAWNRIRVGTQTNNGNAFIRITTPITQTDGKEAPKLLQAYANDLQNELLGLFTKK